MSTPFHLEGKTILVTGASSGIGREVCVGISRMGGCVLAVGRNSANLEETRRRMDRPQEHRIVSLDLLERERREAFLDEMSPVDGVVHAAGILNLLPVKMISEKKLHEIQSINYEVPVLLTQQLLKRRLLREQASLVFISSVTSLVGAKAHALYAGSKAALVGFSRSLALECAPLKIRSNCVSPGMVQTEMTSAAADVLSKEKLAEHARQYPLGLGGAADVSNTVVFLLSDASRWMTGANLVLDGGYTSN